MDSGTIRFLIKEPIQLRYLQRHCTEHFTQATQSATGRLLGIEFITIDELSVRGAEQVVPGTRIQTDQGDGMLLSPDYTFGSFVVGPESWTCHGSSAVAQHSGRTTRYFVHGGVVLERPICYRRFAKRLCATTRTCVSTTHLACLHEPVFGSSTNRRNELIRNRFRNYDLLVIDDIHDLSKRDTSQEEFFHTFNTLYQSGRQVVLSSDAPPNEIPDLEERLTSRFGCGLVANIERPCYETRVAIVKSKAALRSLNLPDDVAGYIALASTPIFEKSKGQSRKFRRCDARCYSDRPCSS